MKDFLILVDYFREHKVTATITALTTIVGALGGALLGALAYYGGWLG